MKTKDIKTRYISFFKKRGHIEIAKSPLVLENDPTTLFTSSGMQQLTPFLMGKKHPGGNKLVNIQPCLRAYGVSDDIGSVGDNSHTTFFEMLGNWSLGSYFKEEQLPWYWEFLTKELELDKEKLFVTVFEGTKEVPRDEKSADIWRRLGLRDEKIFYYGVKNNWWSRYGPPEEMPAGEIGGPDSEVFFDSGQHLKFHENSPYKKLDCHPNCGCGRFLEIGNSVFIQYKKKREGSLEELPQKNVDFGGGLERLAAASQNDPDVFKIDLFINVIKALETETAKQYKKFSEIDKSFRVIADHLRASCLLISEGIEPGNKTQGYILRRLIRRSMFHLHNLGVGISGGALAHVAENFKETYPQINESWPKIDEVLSNEGVRFSNALEKGLAKLRKGIQKGEKVTGKVLFDLYQTDGFPKELSLEILSESGIEFNPKEKELFEEEFKKHKNVSRVGGKNLFHEDSRVLE